MAKQNTNIKNEWIGHLVITYPQRMLHLVLRGSLIFPPMITLMVKSSCCQLPPDQDHHLQLVRNANSEHQLKPSESAVELSNLSFNQPCQSLKTTVIKKSWAPPTQLAAYVQFLPYPLLLGLTFGPSPPFHPLQTWAALLFVNCFCPLVLLTV